MSDTLLAVRDLVKNYQALRPLRVKDLSLADSEIKCIVGLDAPAAEMLVGLLTGALLPDSGEVQLFGRSTADVGDSEAWLALLDQVGIVTDRAVLIEQFTVQQNVAMPFTLEVDPLAEAMRQPVDALMREVGLSESMCHTAVGRAGPDVQARVRLARALALKPRVVIAEHPSASLPRDAVARFAADMGHIVRNREVALLAVTADDLFARSLGGEILKHDAASGALKRQSAWHKLFG